MGYTNFLIWAGKQGFKHGQKYLNKAWQEATRGGKQVLESQFPKLINKAEDLYKNFKTFDPKVVPKTKITPDKVTKIPTSYKAPPSTPKKEGIPIFGDSIQQQALTFFRDLANKQQGIYGPFGKGTDGFRNMTLWMMRNTPKKTMEIMKQYGYKPKVIPKKPPGKAEGGIITVSDPGMGDGPFMMEEFLEAVKKGFKGTYDDYIDQIDRSPRDYLAEGGSTQKDIDKGIAAIEKLKSSLMPESYEELIEIYKDKQKDLNIDIMESAGGLGEMLGEGGRIGMQAGGVPGWIIQTLFRMGKKPKVFTVDDFKAMGPSGFEQSNKMGGFLGEVKNYVAAGKLKLNSAQQKFVDDQWAQLQSLIKQLDDVGKTNKDKIIKFDPSKKKAEGGRIGMMYGGDPGFAFSYGGSWADWKDNHASEMPLMDYINQKLPKARNPFSDSSYQDGGPVIDKDKYDKALRAGKSPAEAYKEAIKDPLEALDLKAQFDEIFKKAEGGRIGMQLGGDLRTRGIMQALKILRDRGYLTEKGKIFPWPGSHAFPDAMSKFKTTLGDAISFGAAKGRILKKQLENDIKGYKDLINNYKKDYSKYELDDFKETINTIKNDIKSVDKYILKSQSKKATKHAEGGRIGMAKGDTPSEAYLRDLFYDGGWDARGDIGLHEFMHGPIGANEWFKHNNKAEGGRIGFKKGGKGGIGDLMSELYRLFSISPLLGSPELTDLIQKIPFEKGGRAGFMSQTGIPYYADKALEGIVNSAETLSKLPFAAGKLGSQLLQSPPDKKMFSEALENITPGSWSKNLGISSLAEAEGAKVSDKQRAIGDVLGLGTEIAVPVGGAFKIGQKIIDQASKAMGKLKKGKTLDQTINDTITNFGQSRRDFNATVAASGLMVALKGIGLGSLLKGSSKKAEDIRVTYKTGINEPYELDDVATWAGNYEFESLTAKGVNILKKVFGKDVRTVKDPSGELTAYVDNVDLGEATSWVNDVKKAGGKMELEHVDDYGSIEPVYQSINKKGVELTDKQKFLNVSSIDSGYGLYDDSIDEVYDIIYDTSKVKKAEGGSVGYPPVQLNPKEQPPIQGPLYETNNPNEAFKEILRRNIGSGIAGAPIGGNFDLGVGYGENKPFDYGIGYNMGKGHSGLYADYGIRDDGENMYTGGYKGDNFDVGVRKEEGGDPTFGFKFKKKFAKGGKAWQPKSAPQLTTTIPPESGPMPQGLTYLTGDDIVQNIGHKHGRN